ncbi:MAG: lactam utilization protein LamB [Rhodospirillaceae bacterium]|nr:lactam utilization protein LamB [Alphaproteobacteria bacterium]MBR71782.1 lactam utilization protein LamB [Rhodospirillaceae bacterium]|tara:strand:+ start:1388 stop:2167 length:780 start_codon:yes stop_codon:yes gene_type:complete
MGETMENSFDINIDCGESLGNWIMGADEELMPLITTANVACGFHAGDPITMQRTVKLAKENNVAVGAHPGLPDLIGFGRRTMSLTPAEVYAMTVFQVGSLKAMLECENMTLHHIKPHGALYSMLSKDTSLGEAFCQATIDISPKPMIYYPAPVEQHAVTRVASKMGIHVVGELYFDLSYADDGSLILKRANEGADLVDTKNRLANFFETGVVVAESGVGVPLEAQSICLHGDGPNAVDLAKTIGQGLRDAGYNLSPLNI